MTPSVTAPGDINPSGATGSDLAVTHTKHKSALKDAFPTFLGRKINPFQDFAYVVPSNQNIKLCQ